MEHADECVPDELALHLDGCASCRDLFNRTRMPMGREDLDGLPAQGRVKLLRTMGAARATQPWKRAAAALAAMLFLALAVLFYSRHAAPPAADPVSIALVEDHIRYLGHPDRSGRSGAETYQAYLQSYVDFPVMIPSLAGARLTGARRCFFLGRRAALAFYDLPEGPASYFVFSAEDLTLPPSRCAGGGDFACSAVQGYQVVTWKEAGLIHAFVGTSRSPLLEMSRAAQTRSSG